MYCCVDEEHSQAILQKTLFRRAKAFAAKRDVVFGVHDAASLLRKKPSKLDSNYYTLFREVRILLHYSCTSWFS